MELQLITALIIKHFIIDFPLQTPFQWMNKGKYGHLGGLLHAVLHGFFTMVVFGYFGFENSGIYGLIDMFIHYHVDWTKMQFKYKPDNKYFWWLLGLDQMLHYLTYVGLVYYAI